MRAHRFTDLVFALTAAALCLVGDSASASIHDVTLQRVSSSSVENVESQLRLRILDQTAALADYGINLEPGQLLFAVFNDGPIDSSITGIRIESESGGSADRIYNNLAGATKFSLSPASLPLTTQKLDKMNSDAWTAAATGTASTGVNPNEAFGVGYSYGTFDEAIDALRDGRLRVSLLVGEIGPGGNQDLFVSLVDGSNVNNLVSVVPEPATLAVWLGLAAGAGLCLWRATKPRASAA